MMSDEKKTGMTGKATPSIAIPDAGHLSVTDSERRYLYAISAIRKKQGYVQSMHIAEYLNCSRPSVSVAVKKMKDKGLIAVGMDGTIQLTPETEMLIAAATANAASENNKVMSSLLSADEISGSCAKYLTAIYQLQKSDPSVHAVDIADHLNISKPSVSRMLKNMAEKGLVAIDENFCITLTDKAMQMIHADQGKDLLTALQEEASIDADAAKCLLAVRELLLKQEFLYAREVAAYLEIPRERVYYLLTKLKKYDLVTFDRANHTFLTEKAKKLFAELETHGSCGAESIPAITEGGDTDAHKISEPQEEDSAIAVEISAAKTNEPEHRDPIKEKAKLCAAASEFVAAAGKPSGVKTQMVSEKKTEDSHPESGTSIDRPQQLKHDGFEKTEKAAVQPVAAQTNKPDAAEEDKRILLALLSVEGVKLIYAKYLLTIYRLSSGKNSAAIGDIAEQMKVNSFQASVTLAELSVKDLVTVNGNSEVSLTNKTMHIIEKSREAETQDAVPRQGASAEKDNAVPVPEKKQTVEKQQEPKPEDVRKADSGKLPVKAYSGDRPFAFISYAHKDSDKVNGIIEKMYEMGYRIWYDEGVEAGSTWDENIAQHVVDCGYFIAVISSNYLDSDNCKDELNFARDEGKQILLVYLEDIKLPVGMRMRLNRLQALMKWDLTDAQFYRKLNTAQDISLVRDQK